MVNSSFLALYKSPCLKVQSNLQDVIHTRVLAFSSFWAEFVEGTTLAALSRASKVITQAATMRKPSRLNKSSSLAICHGIKFNFKRVLPPTPMTTGPAKLRLFNLKRTWLVRPGEKAKGSFDLKPLVGPSLVDGTVGAMSFVALGTPLVGTEVRLVVEGPGGTITLGTLADLLKVFWCRFLWSSRKPVSGQSRKCNYKKRINAILTHAIPTKNCHCYPDGDQQDPQSDGAKCMPKATRGHSTLTAKTRTTIQISSFSLEQISTLLHGGAQTIYHNLGHFVTTTFLGGKSNYCSTAPSAFTGPSSIGPGQSGILKVRSIPSE